jgi:hypothetical protein
MKSHHSLSSVLASAALAFWAASSALAGPVLETVTDSTSSRYGLFNALDHRSAYGKGLFPEPFLVDESDLESEVRFDWLRTARRSTHVDEFRAEIEKSIGVATFELEIPYEREVAPGERADGIPAIELGVRLPFFQYVSSEANFDTTFGAGFEWAIRTGSPVGKNGELVPKLFNDTRIMKRVTLQSVVGVSFVTGPGEEGGTQVLEYGFTLGYTIEHKDLPIPGVEAIIPVFELSGERALNKGEAGVNSLSGLVGVRLNLDAIGPVQPRLGVGYVFPINDIARDDFHSGVYTSLALEF